MKIDGSEAWTNINVSESYEECESLNSTNSTLGTTLLRAHLTTDADWSAMAIFSVSQYGGATTNKPASTTGNGMGIKDVGAKFTQTTGILEDANKNSTEYLYGLFNEDGSVKKYVRKWSIDREKTNFVGFTETYGWLNSGRGYYTDANAARSYKLSIKTGLFDTWIGTWTSQENGGPFTDTTFRPVIWN